MGAKGGGGSGGARGGGGDGGAAGRAKEKPSKERIDALLVARGLVETRTRAKALLMAGKVLVDGHRVDKAGTKVSTDSEITLKETLPYVGRGGLKLRGALEEFSIDPSGLVAADVGSSTGGFTDCLLQRGAAHVYAIDVGRGLLDVKLREDPRVTVMEGVNVRHLDPGAVPEKVSLAVIDVSFISLTKVLPKVSELLAPEAVVLALVKPQFEVGRGEVGKGGIVRDPAKHSRVLESVSGFASTLGFVEKGRCDSPIKGAKGNREFWLLLRAR